MRSTALEALTDEEGPLRGRPARAAASPTLVVVADGFRTVEAPVESGLWEEPLRISLERLFFEVPGSQTVTANRGTHPGDAPTSVAVISGDDLQRREATNLNEALPFAQGVTFNAGQMDIRGSSGLSRGVGSRVLMLLDGHRTLSGVGSSVDFAVLPVLDVERIEIVKGPHSTLWGTNAMGGVVNVITRPPEAGSPDRGARVLRPLRHPGRPATSPTGGSPCRGFSSSTPGGSATSTRRSSRRARVPTVFRPERGPRRLAAAGEGRSSESRQPPLKLFATWKRDDMEEFFTWLSEGPPAGDRSRQLGRLEARVGPDPRSHGHARW